MLSRLRSALSAALITLSCLLVPFGALAAWASYALADTGRYVTTMAPLATDPHIRDAVADTVGAGIMREVERQPDVGQMRGAVGPFVHDAVRSFTRTRAFRLAWDAGNRATHDAVLRALREENGGDDANRGPVTVDLAPVTAQVKSELARDHVPLAARIPVEHTEFAVLPADRLTHLRKGFHILEVAGFWLPVAAVVFAVGGIALAVRRRRAITATALGTAVGGALLGLALAVGRRLTLGDLPADVPQPAAGAVYDALTATLRTVAWLLLALGLVVALTTWLTRNRRVLRRPRPERQAPERTDLPVPPAPLTAPWPAGPTVSTFPPGPPASPGPTGAPAHEARDAAPGRAPAGRGAAVVRRAPAPGRSSPARPGLAPSGGRSYARGRDLTARPATEDEAVEAVEAEPGGWGGQPPGGPTPTRGG